MTDSDDKEIIGEPIDMSVVEIKDHGEGLNDDVISRVLGEGEE